MRRTRSAYERDHPPPDPEEVAMTVLMTVETIALVLLGLLVAGLLRSHAEILRRLPITPSEEPLGRPTVEPAVAPQRGEAPAGDIAGTSLDGEPVKLAVAAGGTSSLIAFLSSGCSTCQGFWEAFGADSRGPLPGGARLIVVTKDSSHESSSKLRDLAPAGVPVVMSSAAWDAYAVPMTPYFVYVDGASGRIAGEGTAEAWPQVGSLLRDALLDAELARTGNGTIHSRAGGAARSNRVDDELRAAGIGPAHPSLYGAGDPSDL
jgi:hypothetical protein